MVTVLLRGGLGNQMFQYALGVALAQANGTHVKLDAVYLLDRLPRRKYTFRDCDLDIFTMNNTPNLTSLSQAAYRVPVPGFWLGIDAMSTGTRVLAGAERVVREKSHAFDSGILKERGDLLLVGYWQSEKYFADAMEELRKAFRFKHPLEGEAEGVSRQIRSSNSVSLHIRRGDYAAFKHVEQTMGPTNLSYYEKAAGYINEQSKRMGIEVPTFFVFSDDIEWCKTRLKLPFPTVYLDQSSAGPKASHHLQMMSLCRNNIIANSTFSWWGAWLNANPEKIVIAPERWFADKANEDLIPQCWMRM
jgi:Glycosyl transferase family 11